MSETETADTEADPRDAAADGEGREGTYLIGPSDSDSDAWTAHKVDTDEEHGIEGTGVAELNDDVRAKAEQAVSEGYVRNSIVARNSGSQQTGDTVLSQTARRYYSPPYDPTSLANLAQRSGTHTRCVHAKAQGVAGHGFDVVPHERHADADGDGDVDEDEEPENLDDVRNFWFGDTTTFQLGPGRQLATPEEVQQNVWWDFEAVGWGCMEIMVNRAAEPTGLSHVPAHRVRKRIDEPGYIELDRNGQIKQYYSEAGLRYQDPASEEADNIDDSQLFVDRWTGEVADSRSGVSEVANELLFIPNYNALTPHYGLPDIIPELQTIASDLAARRYNTRFFENDGVPRFVVAVEGGELTERAFKNLKEKLQELSEEENSHRGMLIEATNSMQTREGAENVSVNIEPLTVGEQEDASFIEFRRENEHDIIKAHSVPPVIVSRTEGSNYANSREQRQEFAQETIRPRQEMLAARIQRTIHAVMFEAPGVTLEFELHGGENRLREAEIAKKRIEAAGPALTLNEWREMVGEDPLETADGEPHPAGNMLMLELMSTTQDGGLTLPGPDDSGDITPPTAPTNTPTESAEEETAYPTEHARMEAEAELKQELEAIYDVEPIEAD